MNIQYFILGAVLLLNACGQVRPGHRHPLIYRDASATAWSSHNGLLYWQNQPFTGYFYALFSPRDTAELVLYQAGKAEGIAHYWYPDGRLREKRFFKAGKRECIHYGWWENGQKSFEYHFKADLHEGMAYSWYPDGHKMSALHYEKGQEAGTQQAWYPDGQLRLNYVVRNGRQYGLTGVKNCATVWDASLGKFQEKQQK